MLNIACCNQRNLLNHEINAIQRHELLKLVLVEFLNNTRPRKLHILSQKFVKVYVPRLKYRDLIITESNMRNYLQERLYFLIGLSGGLVFCFGSVILASGIMLRKILIDAIFIDGKSITAQYWVGIPVSRLRNSE